MITKATESDFLQGNFFPGFSDNSTLLIKGVKGFDERPQKIFLTSLIQKANNLTGKCIETAQFSEFATFFFWYIRSLLERISQGRMTNVNVCFSVLIPKKYPPPPPPPSISSTEYDRNFAKIKMLWTFSIFKIESQTNESKQVDSVKFFTEGHT